MAGTQARYGTVMDALNPPAMSGMPYLRMISALHQTLDPKWYLEVGTFAGRSLALADCSFVAVDPQFKLRNPPAHPGARQMHFFQQTSDDFFASGFCERNDIRFDLAFLDGLHHFEALLRDFINAERLMAPGGVILLHDCCPTSVAMADRSPTPDLWTGDVWKTLLILLRVRKDLEINVASAAPTGLAVVRGLNPDSTVLDDLYEGLVEEYSAFGLDDLEGGLDGYYAQVPLARPRAVLAKMGSPN